MNGKPLKSEPLAFNRRLYWFYQQNKAKNKLRVKRAVYDYGTTYVS